MDPPEDGTQASLVAQMVSNLPAVRETRARSLGREGPLGKGMAAYFSILAWRTPWTEEPGRLQFKGLQSNVTEATLHASTREKVVILQG